MTSELFVLLFPPAPPSPELRVRNVVLGLEQNVQQYTTVYLSNSQYTMYPPSPKLCVWSVVLELEYYSNLLNISSLQYMSLYYSVYYYCMAAYVNVWLVNLTIL